MALVRFHDALGEEENLLDGLNSVSMILCTGRTKLQPKPRDLVCSVSNYADDGEVPSIAVGTIHMR